MSTVPAQFPKCAAAGFGAAAAAVTVTAAVFGQSLYNNQSKFSGLQKSRGSTVPSWPPRSHSQAAAVASDTTSVRDPSNYGAIPISRAALAAAITSISERRQFKHEQQQQQQ
ncbi:uncharacterized protein A4U43_C04F11450 [Asparagus officinalis]|uniref:Uncharacterized protein n=1 Tax=Asparagus officinalis TaxID=4686 RepID=A0A5P1F4I7_ASPOF|nr:uncharacterized protein A4U43_C04F11450 [Asparagus officinalis]